RGFYYFHPDNIIVEADSTVAKDSKVDLTPQLKKSIPELARKQFRIDKVVIFADYNINDLKTSGYEIPYNTDSLEIYEDMYIIDPEDKFKPKIFDRTLQFERGELYNRTDHNLTLNRLVSLGVYKFVKNEFIISDSTQNKFDAYYLLTPREMQSLRLETTGRSNSADYVGSEVNLNWTHRNIFKGAEQFKFTTYGSTDVQMGGQRDANNIYRLGVKAELSIPRFIVPFKINTRGAFVPRTNVSIGYEFLNRSQLYSLHNFNTSFGYLWKENIRKEHHLKLLDATLVYPQNITYKYDSIMQGNPVLQRVVEDQLIFGPTYTYTYTNTMSPIKNTMYYKGMLDLSGNITGLILGADVDGGNQKKIFDIPFSQYAKMEHDFRFYHDFSNKHSIASRVIAGLAYPYGNSKYIPFSRQFFAGGTNSVRAFRARTLGPGSYNPETQNTSFYFDQGGDIRLELNAEYRANIWKFINGAVFVDAGNVWLVNEDPERPGGKFSKDWYKEIAVGAGVGLRLDFSILVLRLDLAIPMRIPYYAEGERWTFDKIDLGDGNWRSDNLIFNLAIGYPF
ncbi:MAG: BamA/TamA family outer membrane protein, partial [Weeksellaceae bacterium]